MLLEEFVARFGPAGSVDVGDRPDPHRPEHPVLLDDGFPAAERQASLAAREDVLDRGQVGNVAWSPGEELEIGSPHLLPVLYAAPGILAGGGADVKAAGAAVVRRVGAVSAGAAGDPERELGDGEEVPPAGDLPAGHQQPHPDLPPVLLGAEPIGGSHLLLFAGGEDDVLPDDFSARIGSANLLAHQCSLDRCGAGVDQGREHRHVLLGLVANLRGRNVQQARSVENWERDTGLVQIHDRRDALGRRVPLEDHFRAVGLGGPRHVEGQGDRSVALRLEICAIDAGLAVEGPLPGLLVVGDQRQHESRRKRWEVLGTEPEGEQDLPSHLHSGALKTMLQPLEPDWQGMRTALPPEAAGSSATAAPRRMPPRVASFSASSDQTTLGTAAEARAAPHGKRLTPMRTVRRCRIPIISRLVSWFALQQAVYIQIPGFRESLRIGCQARDHRIPLCEGPTTQPSLASRHVCSNWRELWRSRHNGKWVSHGPGSPDFSLHLFPLPRPGLVSTFPAAGRNLASQQSPLPQPTGMSPPLGTLAWSPKMRLLDEFRKSVVITLLSAGCGNHDLIMVQAASGSSVRARIAGTGRPS